MNQKITIMLALVVIVGLLTAPTTAVPTAAPDYKIDIPDAWIVNGESAEYPVAIEHSSGTAELHIFRSDLDAGQVIGTAEELKISVQKVIDSVILSLPNAKLISNTGFNETERTGFALEFMSADAESGSVLRHRLMGWLYRHTDGHQILFTLWGKAILQNYPQFEKDFHHMQSGFGYTGPHTAMALANNSKDWALPAVVILMTVGGLWYYRTSREGRRRGNSLDESGWLCSCGVRNSPAQHQCRTCGQFRSIARVR